MFEVTEVAANDHYTFERRDGYNWGPDDTTSDTPGVPKTVIAAMAPNVSTAANQLLSGELNAAPIAGPDKDRSRPPISTRSIGRCRPVRCTSTRSRAIPPAIPPCARH